MPEEPLPPFPDEFSDSDDGTCIEMDIIATGQALVVIDPITKCARALVRIDNSIAIDEGDGIRQRDGSDANPIRLPALKESTDGMVKPLVKLSDGQIVAVLPEPGATKKVVTTSNGGFDYDDWEEIVCFDPDNICACEPDFFAGFYEENGKLCLAKIPLGDLGLEIPEQFFGDTITNVHLGTGTAGDPHKFDVQVSAEEGNRLEINPDGLFVPPLPCPQYGWIGDPCHELI